MGDHRVFTMSSVSLYVDMAKPIRMVLDVDTGMDDAMALLLAQNCPGIDLLAVTVVNGNCSVQQALQNTLQVLDAAGAPADLPVAQGFEQPLVEPIHPCASVHGNDGLGDLQPPLPPSRRKAVSQHAVAIMLDALQNSPDPVTVVALGPLTNVAVAIRTDPGLWRSKCNKLVWMGGSVKAGGNSTAWAEANAFCDPEAAHMVLTSGLPVLLYPWDVFLKVEYTASELEELGLAHYREFENTDTCGGTAGCAARMLFGLMRNFQAESSTIGDAGAVAAVLCPEALTTQQMHVTVELQGAHTRGMTVFDTRPFPSEITPHTEPNVEVVLDVDVAALKAVFTKHVLQQTSDQLADADIPGRDVCGFGDWLSVQGLGHLQEALKLSGVEDFDFLLTLREDDLREEELGLEEEDVTKLLCAMQLLMA